MPTMSQNAAMSRIMRQRMESETLRSGTERGNVSTKTSKAKTTKPKLSSHSKVIKGSSK